MGRANREELILCLISGAVILSDAALFFNPQPKIHLFFTTFGAAFLPTLGSGIYREVTNLFG
jgi:hypothetical protein